MARVRLGDIRSVQLDCGRVHGDLVVRAQFFGGVAGVGEAATGRIGIAPGQEGDPVIPAFTGCDSGVWERRKPCRGHVVCEGTGLRRQYLLVADQAESAVLDGGIVLTSGGPPDFDEGDGAAVESGGELFFQGRRDVEDGYETGDRDLIAQLGILKAEIQGYDLA